MKHLVWALACLVLAVILLVLGYADLATRYQETLGWFNLLSSMAWFYMGFTAIRKFRTR